MHIFKPAVNIGDKKPSIKIWYIYLIAVIFNFHSLLVAYVSPTYIGQFLEARNIGLLYSISAIGSLVCFSLIPIALKKFGNVFVVTALMTISILTLAVIGSAYTTMLIIIGFFIFQIVNPLIYLNLDIFSETTIGTNEEFTGHVRGLILSLMSLAALFAPLTISYLVGNGDNLAQLYFVAIGVGAVFTLLILILFRRFSDPVYEHKRIFNLLHKCWTNKSLRLVISAHFLLQIFFAWTIIYIPLYLATVVGLPWSSIGSIIAAGLLAYVLLEYPIGILADNYFGEKEMMALGFLILAVSAASISFMSGSSLIEWMILMFISRAGASLVEVTTETYFFKKITGENANLMSVFRLTRPLSILTGSLLGSICLYFMPFNLAFVVLGSVMVLGMFITFGIEDTK